jgi:hypothetical protein
MTNYSSAIAIVRTMSSARARAKCFIVTQVPIPIPTHEHAGEAIPCLDDTLSLTTIDMFPFGGVSRVIAMAHFLNVRSLYGTAFGDRGYEAVQTHDNMVFRPSECNEYCNP